MDKTRRIHARFPSDLTVEVFSGPVGGVRIGEGTLLDLSLGGCLLSVRGTLSMGATYRVSLKWKDEVVDLPGRMVRDAGRSPKEPASRRYGISFNLTGGQEKKLMHLIDVVRRTQKPDDKGGFMSSYWG